jgi:hypothetical protein
MAPSNHHHQYDRISPSSLDDKDADGPYSDQNSEDEPFLELRLPGRISRLRSSLPWALCAVFAATSTILAVILFQQPRCKIGQEYINDFSKSIKDYLIPLQADL